MKKSLVPRSCTAPATENASLQILVKCPTPAIILLILTRCTIPCACQAKPHLNVQKCSVPRIFCTFDFEMCFARQRRALFRHLNFQRWSEHGSFCTFWLRNVLRATTARTFSTSQLPKVVRSWCALYILTSKCASRHNGVHFFDISTSKSGPRMVCFVHLTWKCASRHNGIHFFDKWSGAGVFCTFFLFMPLLWPAGSAPAALASLLFDPPEPQIIGKTQCFATFLPFRAPGSSFFWLFFFFWSSLFYSSLLSDSSRLCFSSVHIVGSLTSKLPSITYVQVVHLGKSSWRTPCWKKVLRHRNWTMAIWRTGDDGHCSKTPVGDGFAYEVYLLHCAKGMTLCYFNGTQELNCPGSFKLPCHWTMRRESEQPRTIAGKWIWELLQDLPVGYMTCQGRIILHLHRLWNLRRVQAKSGKLHIDHLHNAGLRWFFCNMSPEFQALCRWFGWNTAVLFAWIQTKISGVYPQIASP